MSVSLTTRKHQVHCLIQQRLVEGLLPIAIAVAQFRQGMRLRNTLKLFVE